jgi:hypothetical protein
MDAVYQTLGYAIAALMAMAFQRAWAYGKRSQFWRTVEERTVTLLRDPAIPIDDPHEAATTALADVQSERIARIVKNVTASDDRTVRPPDA